MFRDGKAIAECVECGSRAVVIAGKLTSDALVLCGDCESPRGIFVDFFEEISAAHGESSSLPEGPAQSVRSPVPSQRP
jgi:hypothetical protein